MTIPDDRFEVPEFDAADVDDSACDSALEDSALDGSVLERSALFAVPLGRLALFAVMALAIVVASLVDVPRSRQAGSMTWLGLITIVQSALGVAALLLMQRVPTRVAKMVALPGAFVLWAALSMIWAPPHNEGMQNAAVYFAFAVLITVAAVATAGNQSQAERVIGVSIVLADVVALGIVAASLALRGWPTNIDAVPWFVHPRALALFGLVPLSWHLARWTNGNARSAVGAGLWVIALFVSLSRTATAIALLLVVLAFFARARGGRATLPSRMLLLALVPVVIAAALTVTPFRDRLFFRPNRTATTTELQVRDNGRTIMWRIVAESALEAPILGKGLGSSEPVVSNQYEWVGHPHNEYLRVWHDLGIVGLVLLLAAFVVWWRALWTEWRRRSGYVVLPAPTLQLAAMGALLALLLGMLTDNSLVYNFVMAPTAVLIGAGLGARSPFVQRRRKRRNSEGGIGLPDDEVEASVERVRVRKRKRR